MTRIVMTAALSILLLPQAHAAEVRSPNTGDYVATGAALSGLLGLELMQERIGPLQPRFNDPIRLDATVRHYSVLETSQGRRRAALASDILFYGLYFPAIVAVPVGLGGDAAGPFNIMAQSLGVAGLLTNAAKLTVARQRPYRTFGTEPGKGVDDNLSFFSGHTSLSFSLATAAGMLLANHKPDRRAMIWPAVLAPAVTIGYLRIASDRHYLTDVLVGALVGAATGFLVSYGWDSQLGPAQRDSGPVLQATLAF